MAATRNFWRSLSIVSLLSGAWLFGQGRMAEIQGTVKDDTGAPIPGVSLTVVQVETGLERKILTDETGRYQAPNLEPGDYRVTAELTGFRTVVRSGVKLTVGRQAVVDISLPVGELTEQVVVTGEAPLVETTQSVLGEIVDDQKIRDLPLNGRDYFQLTLLQPSVLPLRVQGDDITRGNGRQMSIGGARPSQNNFRLDGMSISDHSNNAPGAITGNNLGVDAIREFKVLTHNFSAEFGRASGGVVTAVTKSGTNEFHGTAFYFHRNDNLDARNFFDLAAPPEFKRNQFGASLGGPVVRDRTFFFSSYEGVREILGVTATSVTLSDAAKQGRLSTGTVTPDPNIVPLLQILPSPNGPLSSGGETGVFSLAGTRTSPEDFFTARMDHSFSERDKLFGRYTMDDAGVTAPGLFNLVTDVFGSRNQYVSLDFSQIFSQRLLNTLRFGFNRSFAVGPAREALNPLLDDPKMASFSGKSMSQIAVTGFAGLPGGTGSMGFDLLAFNSWQGYDDVTYIAGRHSLKMGVSVERIQYNQNSSNNPTGDVFFDSIAAFLSNRPSSFQTDLPGTDAVRGWRQTLVGSYVQDDIRVKSNLALNLGLRYEPATVPDEVNGKVSNLRNLLDANMDFGPDKRLFENSSKLNFQPRVGLAWDPFQHGKTSIRAGFGIFDDLILVHNLLLSGVRNPPYFLRGSITGQPGDFPKGFLPRIQAARTGVLDVEMMESEPGRAYMMQWNLALQQDLGWSTVVTVGYLGSRGTRLTNLGEDSNLAIPQIRSDGSLFFPAGGRKRNPNFARIRTRDFSASSFYHGFQLGVVRRFSSGIQFQSSYTFGKSLDDFSAHGSSNEFNNTVGNPWPFDPRFNRGISDFDIRHNFVANWAWDMPDLPGHAPWNKLFGGWQLGGIVNASSGLPITPVLGFDAAQTAHTRRGKRLGQRPNLAPGFDTNAVTGLPSGWFDLKAFALPALGTFGNLGRSTITGPGLVTVDFSLVKKVPILSVSESFQLQFRAEFFNVLNRANFNVPAQEQLEVFDRRGRLVQTAGLLTSTISTSRQVQLGLKIIF
ncbi:MAG: TonB-dependent receptor [Acidobacteria bacterium]|nr:TonB-dependent receptor [Acidobacteriota bacterium]